MSGILRMAAASSRPALLKPAAGYIRAAGIHRHAILPKNLTPLTAQSKRASLAMPALNIIKQQRASYHDDGAYGYRVPKVYSMPDYTPEELANRVENANLLRLVIGYRTHGHRKANLDPLGIVKGE
ncbi:hypothetical protein BGZ94_002468 [Podila epigama]|nr:hypothetical protein BGZ94_002468 [Podila epigama]